MSENILAKGLEIWTIMAANYIMLLSLFIGTFLHLSSDYLEKILKRFEIKMGRDNFTVIYYVVRDGALFVSFVVGILLINPDMMGDVKIAVPFMPYGTVFLGLALLMYLKVNLDENQKMRKTFSFLLFMAVLFQYIGFTFVMEAKPHEWIKETSSVWSVFRSMRSNLNPSLSMFTFYTSFPLILLIVMGFFFLPSKRRK